MKAKRFAYAVMAIGLILAISAVAAPPPGAPTMNDPEATKGLTKEAIDQAKAGKIVFSSQQARVEGGGQALIQVAMVFNVPIQEAYKLLKETDKQCDYLDECDKNTLIMRTSDHDIVEFEIKVIGFTIKYRVRHTYNDKMYRTSWKLDDTFKNDLKYMEGYWHLYYMDDNHTWARYGAKLVVKDFIPKTVQDTLTKRDLPKTLESVRKRVDSHGVYKKKGR